MTSLTITGLDEALTARLRESAVRHGRSAEDEARAILESALADTGTQSHATPEGMRPGEAFWRAVWEPLAPFGGVELDLPPRGPGREPPAFGENGSHDPA